MIAVHHASGPPPLSTARRSRRTCHLPRGPPQHLAGFPRRELPAPQSAPPLPAASIVVCLPASRLNGTGGAHRIAELQERKSRKEGHWYGLSSGQCGAALRAEMTRSAVNTLRVATIPVLGSLSHLYSGFSPGKMPRPNLTCRRLRCWDRRRPQVGNAGRSGTDNSASPRSARFRLSMDLQSQHSAGHGGNSLRCESAPKFDPLSASNRDPVGRCERSMCGAGWVISGGVNLGRRSGGRPHAASQLFSCREAESQAASTITRPRPRRGFSSTTMRMS